MTPNQKRTIIAVPALDANGKAGASEQLEAIETDGVYRLLYSPGLVEGLAAGDEIELVSNEPSGFRIVSRSGNLCVWFYLKKGREITTERDLESYADVTNLRAEVEHIGGWLDGGTGHRELVFTVPINVGWEKIGKVFDDAVARMPGTTWMFANVYDQRDGHTPLNWWKH